MGNIFSNHSPAISSVLSVILDAYSSYDTHWIYIGMDRWIQIPKCRLLSGDPVSLFNPLHHVLASMNPSSQNLSHSLPSNSLLLAIDAPLKSIVLVAQVNAGLWARNGMTLRKIVQYYSTLLRSHLYDFDISLLARTVQGAVAHDVALPWILDRFGLLPGENMDPCLINADGCHENADPIQRASLVEDCIHLLIYLATHEIEALREHEQLLSAVEHWLALGPASFSELRRRLPQALRESGVGLDTLVASVSDYSIPNVSTDLSTEATGGRYSLSSNRYKGIHLFYKHYTKNDRVIALSVLDKAGFPGGFLPTLEQAQISWLYHPILPDFISWVLNMEVKTDGLTTAIGYLLLQLMRPEHASTMSNRDLFSDIFGAHKEFILSLPKLLPPTCPYRIRIMQELTRRWTMECEEHKISNPTFTEHSTIAKEHQQRMLKQMEEQRNSFLARFADELEYSDDDQDSDENSMCCLICQQTLQSDSAFGYVSRFEVSRKLPQKSNSPQFIDGESLSPLRIGIYISTCGHALHEVCLDRYRASGEARRALEITRHTSMERAAFMCPLCKFLGSTLIPAHPFPVTRFEHDFEEFCAHMKAFTDNIRPTSTDSSLPLCSYVQGRESKVQLVAAVVYTISILEMSARFESPAVDSWPCTNFLPHTLLVLPHLVNAARKYILVKPLDSDVVPSFTCLEHLVELLLRANSTERGTIIQNALSVTSSMRQEDVVVQLRCLALLCESLNGSISPKEGECSVARLLLTLGVESTVKSNLITLPSPALVSLPESLGDLLAHGRDFICFRCGLTPRDIAMCLICGTRVCMQSVCCANPDQSGECYQHKLTYAI
jgi:hypothetical protein